LADAEKMNHIQNREACFAQAKVMILKVFQDSDEGKR
jgi:hypothetical protein